MALVCDAVDNFLVRLEKNDEDDSFGFDGVYDSASSTATSLAPFGVPGESCCCCFCAGGVIGLGLSCVGCEENLELKLFIHDCLLEPLFPSPPTFSALARARRPGRFGCDLAVEEGVGGVERADVVSCEGCTGVGGVIIGGEGNLLRSEDSLGGSLEG